METKITYEQRLRGGLEFVLREGSEFFQHRGSLYETLRSLARRLDEEQIPYVVIGAIALAELGHPRFTQDIDILLTKEGLQTFHTRCLGRGYVAAFPGAQKTFRATDTGVRIEVVTSGEYPGDGLPKPVSFPDPAEASTNRSDFHVLTLERFVELKLASGMTAPHRLRDLADIQDLIRSVNLSLEFAEHLDPSVRETYRRLWGEVQAPDRVVEV